LTLADSHQGLELAVFWIIVGGLAGWLASLVARTGPRMGCLLNVVVGIVGAVVGGWLYRNLGVSVPQDHRFWATVLMAFIGAVVLLLILRLLGRLARH